MDAPWVCPVCGRPSAPNALIDLRCAPCHNSRLVGFDGPHAVLLRQDFESWACELGGEFMARGTLAQYRDWFVALRQAHDRHEKHYYAELEARAAKGARRIRRSYEHWRAMAERMDRFWASRAEKSREGSEHPNVAGTELARFLDEGRNTAERGRLNNQRFLFVMLLQTRQLLGAE